MEYDILLDSAAELGYRLALCGAETFRVEESVTRVLAAYGVESEVFVIPNCLIVSIETTEGKPMTRMRRIGHHGNDLDGVERYSNLSRAICFQVPEPVEIKNMLATTEASRLFYRMPMYLLGHFLSAGGYAIFFGGNFIDALCAGACGILVGLVSRFFNIWKVNNFFGIICSAFILALSAYAMDALAVANNTDAIVIGALMLLVPGLLFTNAMRDIIFGDTNSGTNRIMQVLLVAAAIALGTGTAWNAATVLWGTPVQLNIIANAAWLQCLAAFIGCAGFAIIFNIRGFGIFLCAFGGAISWAAYCIAVQFGCTEIIGYFIAGIVAAVYSEVMARIRKYPAISYLVIAIFPMIPGAGIYYTTGHLIRGDMSKFADQGVHTIAIAGVIAVGILMVSTIFRFYGVWKQRKTVS